MNAVKEGPILLNAEMVRAILDGRKTQTRRVLKISEHCVGETWVNGDPDDPARPNKDQWYNFTGSWDDDDTVENSVRIQCPFGKPGDRLWVRETFLPFDLDWKYPGRPHDLRDGPWPNVAYEADQDHHRNDCLKWRPSIHMPRWASRITLEIKNVRVERLQAISEEDAKAEGVFLNQETGSYVGSFHWTWDITYGADSWKENPWVWVIEFERVK
ncbi:hypothetical protein [Bdellovibrio bacteriovorus]|uniref:hypothetical protein n=1 Tax=Bdellovibrio bacteriovorus TaxID=959 RepID=UPI003AA9C08F